MENEPKQTIELGKLHTRGVELRNEGQRIKIYKPWTWGKLKAWIDEYYEWKTKVFDLVFEISPALAQRVQTLNRIPESGNYRFWSAVPSFVSKHVVYAANSHRTHLRTLERRLEVLEEILAKFSGTDTALLPHMRKGFK